MAKPKRHMVIEKCYATRMLVVYCDRHTEQSAEIKSIEGVNLVTIWEDKLWVYTDPRYDLDEIATEIEDMLTPIEVPKAFLEAMEDCDE
jgi:hypothetical protein